MKKILIIEDDRLIAELESDYLEANGFQSEICEEGLSGLEKSKNESFDLILLDVMLPNKNGFEILKEIRKVSNIPILLVSAKKDDIDKIRGLGLGADDYISKPFSPSELVARVKSHIAIHERLLKLSTKPMEKIIEIKNLKINPSSHRVFLNEKELILANREYELLYFLASNPNIVFSKDQLFDKIWGVDIVGDVSTVAVHINRLRDKLESDSSKSEYIETVWGAGYRFTI